MPQLSQILVYPIKSVTGISVDRWPLDAKGLQYDRQWMLVDHDGQFLSQRQLPTMALIRVRLTQAHLIVSAPGQTDLVLALIPPSHAERLSVDIWKDRCEALAVSAEADVWFSTFLQRPCRLVLQAPDDVRQVDPQYAQPQDQTGFSDGFPLLVIAQNSLNDLNQAMNLNLSMARFRPNLVISDCPAYAEDTWRRIEINAIELRLPKPCSRCSVPAIDPETAQVGKEPLTTLNKLRKSQGKIYFGQNALHNQSGWLTVGDAVQILETGQPQPLLNP